jgi:hypothetical protein
MSHLDPEHPLYVAEVRCPKCGAEQRVTQVQGTRCRGCGLEFKLFREEEEDMARDFFNAIAGEKYLVPAPSGGFVLLHE